MFLYFYKIIGILKSRWFLTLLGAIGGFIYWKFVGCSTGTCVIQQNWHLSTLWGASLGWLIAGIFNGGCCGGNSCNIPTNKNKSINSNKNNQEE